MSLLPSPRVYNPSPYAQALQGDFDQSALGAGLMGTARDAYLTMLRNRENARSWDTYFNRLQSMAQDARQFAPGLNTAQMVNAAGDTAEDVRTEYLKALSRVAPSAEALASYAQQQALARDMVSAADRGGAAAMAAADASLGGLRRDMARAARQTGSASALRDIASEIAQRGIGNYATIAASMADAASRNLAGAGQLLSSAPQTLQQSQALNYQLWAKPREAQLTPTGTQLAMRDTVYDSPVVEQELANMLGGVGRKYLNKFLWEPPITGNPYVDRTMRGGFYGGNTLPTGNP
jgi:hypothetical protein